jgi:mannan endo-1,4-beta-mannosidase
MNKVLLSFFIAGCGLFSCAEKNEEGEPAEEITPVLLSANPPENSTISPLTEGMELVFAGRIAVIDKAKITLNNRPVQNAAAKDDTLSLQLGELEELASYTLRVEPSAIKAIPGVMNKEAITITFRTSEAPPLSAALAAHNPSPEAVKLYAFLKESFGEKTISGAMANVSWNANEAEWVHRHTGKYPALNGFDYIHHYAGWVDYTNTQVVEDWWGNNGLVAICWHWNVPTAQGSSAYAFYAAGHGTPSTAFDIAKAVQNGTYENGIVTADLETIAGYLLLLKEKNIPVLWRPLHEAAGGWFWWGAKGAAPLKALWKLMFETFEAKGLNNLIWVWTAEPNDAAWYPGDEYVDIVGRDVYRKPAAAEMAGEYATLKSRFPNKIVTLSECGNVAGLQEQTAQGARWSWFMPWYDYNRTGTPGSAAFGGTAHEYADATWWRNAFDDPRVLSRDEIPDELKN